MYPVLMRWGPVAIYSYGLALVVAFLVGTWLAGRAADALPRELVAITPSQTVDLTCVSLLGGIAGARVFYVLLYWNIFMRYPQEILALWHGGLVWYGGLFGSVLIGWGYVRVKGLSALRVADHLAPFLALGHAIGRLGCFLNGCCYGKPTASWYGIWLPGYAEAVLPTQAFEMAGLLVIFLGLRQLQRPAVLMQRGRISGLYLLSYAILRFIIEALRGDQVVWWAGLTLQQFVSLFVLAGGIVLLVISANGGGQRGPRGTTVRKANV